MKLSCHDRPLKLVDTKTGEHLCEVCMTTFHIRETAPEKKPNVELQELKLNSTVFIGILLLIASCNWIWSLWK